MKKFESLLDRLWLSENERIIYLTLLENPYLTVSDIARKTKYHRPMVYKSLAALESEGYIEKSFLEWKRYFYHATSPTKLRDKLDEIRKIADHLIPEMEELHNKKYEAPILSVREGIDWIRSIHGDLVHSLKKGDTYFRYSSTRDQKSRKVSYIPNDYILVQKSKELSRFVITNKEHEAINNNNPYREIISIPSSFDPFDDNISKIIYGNKVAIIDYDSQMGFIIENERFARYEEKIFRLLYSLIKKSRRSS